MSDNTSTDLIIKLPTAMTADTFTNEEEFEKLYSKVKEAVDSHVPDLTTKTGREAIASVAYKVARTKTALVKQGKALTEEWRENTKKVNAACNTIEERLDKLKDDVRRPLTEWEDAEAARIQKHKDGLEALLAFSKIGYGQPSEKLREAIAEVENTAMGEEHWDEFAPQAGVAKIDALDTLKRLLVTAEKQEAEAAELEKLRAEKAERDRQDAERLAAEQAIANRREYAKGLITHIKQCALGMIGGQTYPYGILFRELEEKIVIDDACGDMGAEVEEARQEALKTLRAAQEQDRKKAEAERLEQERLAEEQRKADIARAAAEAAEKAEREAAEKLAAAERAAKDAEERAARQIEEAKAEADRKAEVERKRIADEKAAAAEEQRRRDADKEHRKTVNGAIVAELVECSGITTDQAQKIVVHMVSGLVPNVTLKY